MKTKVSSPYVGQALRTIEGRAPIVGAARFTADYRFDRQAYVHIVRSPHAAATIRRVDLDAARRVSGVIDAIDGAIAAEQINPIPHYIDASVFGGKTTDVRALALNEVVHFGQPVAAVLAEDLATAREAAERIKVDYEGLPAVVEIEDAVADGARTVLADWDDNTLMQVPFQNGDFAAAAEKADRIVKTRVRIHRFSTQPIETRGYNAVWDAQNQGITLYATAQNPHPLRHVLANTLRLPENRVRIVAPAVGGAFGMKMHGHPEESLVCLLAMRNRRPAKWIENRAECLLIGAREQLHDVELAMTDDGDILGLRDRFYANTGAPTACPGWGMAFLTGLTMPGPYRVQNLDVEMNAVVTNKPPWNASRGYGKEATALALELSIDNAARSMGLDPVDVRCRNFVRSDEFPYPSPTGLVYDSGDYEGCVRKVLDALGYEDWRQRQSAALEDGRYLGIGLAYELTPEGGALPGTMVAGYDSSTVRADPNGSVIVLTGVTTPGTGNPTGIAQIVADELGVDIGSIEVVQGDTTTCPYGFGNYSGRSTIVGGGSAALAAADVRDKVLKVAAALLEVPVERVRIDRGVVSVDGDVGKQLSFAEVCYAAYTRAYDVASCIDPPLEATRTFKPGLIRHTPDEQGRINPYPSYSNAAYATVCEVDIETGVVKLLKFAAAHDCGKAINPVLVEGQACGAIAFGVGGILNEEIVIDPAGRQLTTSFEDYVMPRALDMPEVAMAHHDSPNPVTFMGLKGAGEAGVGGSAAAVVNAVNDALSSLGVSMTELPLTAPRIWDAIQAAREDSVKPVRKAS